MWQGKRSKGGTQQRAKQIYPKHHLLSRYLVSNEYFVLCRVHRAVKDKVDKKVEDADKLARRALFAIGCSLGWLFAPESHEDADAGRNHCDNQIFMRGKAPPVHDKIHEHDWDEFAGFS